MARKRKRSPNQKPAELLVIRPQRSTTHDFRWSIAGEDGEVRGGSG